MSGLKPGDQTGNLYYEVGADSLPTGASDYVAFGNRQYYQARGYAEVSNTPGSALPCYLSGQINSEKKDFILPSGAQVFASRIALSQDTLQGVGSDSGAVYTHWQPVNLGTDTFVPRINSLGTTGTSLNFAVGSNGVSGTSTNFLSPLPALTGARRMNVFSSGSTGVRTAKKGEVTQIGVEVEFSMPYDSRNVSFEKIVIL
jgi:hypothetical protein